MEIQDTINELKELIEKLNRYTLIRFIPFLLIPFIYFVSDKFFLFFPLVVLIFLGCGFIISLREKAIKEEFKRIYKETFVVKLLSEWFDDVVYEWESGVSPDYVKELDIVQQANGYDTEDYLSASYKGVHFEQADVKIEHRPLGKNSEPVKLFKGRMIEFDFPNKKVESVRVFSDSFAYRASSKNKKIELESVDFNRRFFVDSANQYDAFYLLTPKMMGRIEALNDRFGNVAIHLRGNKLFIAINTASDTFDHDITKPIDYNSESAKIKADMQVIVDIIDTLSLYT